MQRTEVEGRMLTLAMRMGVFWVAVCGTEICVCTLYIGAERISHLLVFVPVFALRPSTSFYLLCSWRCLNKM